MTARNVCAMVGHEIECSFAQYPYGVQTGCQAPDVCRDPQVEQFLAGVEDQSFDGGEFSGSFDYTLPCASGPSDCVEYGTFKYYSARNRGCRQPWEGGNRGDYACWLAVDLPRYLLGDVAAAQLGGAS